MCATDAVQIGSTLNSEFNIIAHHFKMVRYKGTTSSGSNRTKILTVLTRIWRFYFYVGLRLLHLGGKHTHDV